VTRRVDARSVGSRSISKSIDRTIDRSKSIDRTRSIDRYFDSMIRMFDCSNVRHFDDFLQIKRRGDGGGEIKRRGDGGGEIKRRGDGGGEINFANAEASRRGVSSRRHK